MKINCIVPLSLSDQTIKDILCEAPIGYWGKFTNARRNVVELNDPDPGQPKRLRVHLPKGFRLMAKDPKQCSRLQNFASENWDGEDEDVLLQFATLGKIVYG